MQKANGVGSWNNLQFVLAVARHGSFLKAARLLETNQSTVARRIQRLESTLGTKIFDRHAHGMELTPAGRVLFDKAVAVEGITHEIGAGLSGLDTKPAGTVRIAATDGLGYLWLTPAIAEFCDLYRDIDIEIATNREGTDLLAHESDIALTIDRPSENRLVVARAARVQSRLFLSQKYAASHGLPVDRDDLSRHEFCDYVPHRPNAEVSSQLEPFNLGQRVRFRTNSASVYLAAIRGGIGIGLLPMFYRFAASDLLELDIDTGFTLTFWLVSHEETNKAKRIRLVLSFLMKRFARDSGRWFEKTRSSESTSGYLKHAIGGAAAD